MNAQVCSRCLSRALQPLSPFVGPQSWLARPRRKAIAIALFSTSPPLLANPVKGKKNTGIDPKKPQRGQKMTFTKVKKKAQDEKGRERGRRPGVGERKAYRKRVVLSNTNALAVPNLQELKTELIANESSIGTVVGIPGTIGNSDTIIDRLRAVEAFKPTQGWSLFRQPAMLIRKETVQYGRLMEDLGQEEKSRTIRRVFVGERGSGKTTMLLQAMAMAMLKNWIVINIPDAMDITIASSNYAPLPGTSPPEYIQPEYCARLLDSIVRANPILATIKLSAQAQTKAASQGPASSIKTAVTTTAAAAASSYTELPPFPPTITLQNLAQLGVASPQSSHAILTLLLSEFKLPSRPPLLFCLDGLGFAMRTTKYMDGLKYRPIHAHDFSIIRTFLAHLSGAQSLGPAGGMVLAAVSESNRPRVEALDVALGQLEASSTLDMSAVSSPSENPSSATFAFPELPLASLPEARLPQLGSVSRDPFKKYDERVMSIFETRPSTASSPSSAKSTTATVPDTALGSKASLSDEDRLQVQRIPGLSRAETKGLMEYWARSGIYRGKVDEVSVGEKWSLSGGGVIGEMERTVVRGLA